ncbi:hypothetical protein ACWFQ8_20285 [Streptomyces sp. NPDC055254]
MELPTIAAPGVMERADAAADAACHLYDTVAPWRTAATAPTAPTAPTAATAATDPLGALGGWSRGSVEDAAEAIETLAHALASVEPDAEVVLAPVHTALAELRRRLGLAPADALTADGLPATPRTVGNPRRTRVLTAPSPRQPPSRTTS